MTKKKSNAGRNTKYTTAKIKILYEKKRQGLTDRSIYKSWGISHDTFYNWIKKHAEFSEAHKKGAEDSLIELAQLAKSALFKSVEGFESTETQVVKKKIPNMAEFVVEKKEIKKYHPPNITGILAALHNTDRENFQRDPKPPISTGLDIVGTKYTRISEKENA